MERYLAGEALPEEIDDYVDTWHRTPRGQLNEFLGMSQEEYARWLLNPDALDEIANARKKGERRNRMA